MYIYDSSKIIGSPSELEQIENSLSEYKLPRELHNIFLALIRTVRRQILTEQLKKEIHRVKDQSFSPEVARTLTES